MWAAAGLAVTALLASGWWATTRLRIVTVDGWSMAPALRDGDRILVWRARACALRRGDVAMVELSPAAGRRVTERGWVIKRVAALPGDPAPAQLEALAWAKPRVPAGMVVLLGDNPDESVDSRDFGYVPIERVFGRAVRRLGGGATPS